MREGEHQQALDDALRIEADAQRMLQAGDPAASDAFLRAAARYRESWELAPPRSYGRLIGMLKAELLGGKGDDAARFVVHELSGGADSPASSYPLAVAALALGDDELAARAATGMRGVSPPFERAADAIDALAAGNIEGYRAAIDAIVQDFAAREEHLTGVPIADTALMLDHIAERRGMAVRPPLVLPAV